MASELAEVEDDTDHRSLAEGVLTITFLENGKDWSKFKAAHPDEAAQMIDDYLEVHDEAESVAEESDPDEEDDDEDSELE